MSLILMLFEHINFMATPFTIVSITDLDVVVQFHAPLTKEQFNWILPVLIRHNVSVTATSENVYSFILPSTGAAL